MGDRFSNSILTVKPERQPRTSSRWELSQSAIDPYFKPLSAGVRDQQGA
jgi:hypothetical protein